MNNVPYFAKISPEIAEISKDALTKLGFQLTKSDEMIIYFTKGNLIVMVVKQDFYDLITFHFRFDNYYKGFRFGPELEFFFTGDDPITQLIHQQYQVLISTNEYQSLNQADQREQTNLIIAPNILEMIKRFLPKIENNFDPEKYLAWRAANQDKFQGSTKS